MRNVVACCGLFLLLLATGPAPAAAQVAEPSASTIGLDEPLPVDPAVRVGSLANGLRYYIRENDEPENRAELRLVVNVGSVVEDDDQQGLAHFLEHMAFNGTEHFRKQELVEYMESIGMQMGAGLNASTGFDETTYVLRVPTDSAGVLETAFLILEDWAHGQTFDREEIDRERGVIVEEWRLGRGAGARMRDVQTPVLFQGARYAERLPIGKVEVVESFDPDALERFYRDWYRPDLMAVVAVGDFDADRVETLVREHFSLLENPLDPRPREVYDVPDHDETLFAIATDAEATSSSVAIYFKQPLQEQGSVRAYRQEIVEGFFTSMLNQRLAELRLQADPPFLSAGSSQGRLTRGKSAYMLSASVEDGGIPTGLRTILTEAERVARHGFTAAELERARTTALRSMERAWEARDTRSSASFVGTYVGHFLHGSSMADIGFRYELFQRFVPEIGVDEVNALARRWITDGNRVVLVNAPEKEGLETPTEAGLTAAMERVYEGPIEPWVETLAEEPLIADLPVPGSIVSERVVDTVGVTEWELSNGILVALKPTDFADDQIVFRATSPGGMSLVETEDLLPVASAGSLVSGSGVGVFGPIDLRKKLTGKVAGASAFIDELEEGLAGSASPRDLETMFQLIHLRFMAPRADTTLLEAAKTSGLASLQNRSASPAAAFADTLQVTMTGNHPRAPLPSEEVILALDAEQALALYRDRFADASDFTFVFVGDLDPETMRPLVERYLASLPDLGRDETWRDVAPSPPEGVVVKTVRKGLEPRSQSMFVFTGAFEDLRINRTTLQATTGILETRLRERVREELGGTYGVSVGGSNTWRPTGRYSITVSFGADPERVEELAAVVLEEIRTLQGEGPDEEDLANQKEALRRARQTNLESNGYWLGQLMHRYQKGEELTDFWGYEASIDALTPEMIAEAAGTYFDLENYVRVTLYPEGGAAGGARPAAR